MASSLRILIAEQYDVFRRGLRSLVSAHDGWLVCGDTRSGIKTIKLALELKPDIVILGFELSELNGVETARELKRQQPSIEILLYTAHDEEELIAQAFRAGVRGHVLKSDPEETLIRAVSDLAEHRPFLSTKASEALLNRLQRNGSGPDEAHALTSREREIVRLISEGESNKKIGVNLGLSVKTVEAHRSAIMRKLGFNSITDLVRYAIRNGLIQA